MANTPALPPSRPEPPTSSKVVPPVQPTEVRPTLRPIPAWVIVAGLPVMVLVAVAVVWLLLGLGVDSGKLDAIRTGGTLGVGLGGVLVLWLAIRRQRSTELDLLAKYEAHELAERTAANTLTHQQQVAADARDDATARRITDLYTKAGDQLGSDQAVVRLAGLHALERLGNHNPDQHEAIGALICGYLRMVYHPPLDELPEDADQDAHDRNDARAQEREARQSSLDILIRHHNAKRPDLYWPDLIIRLQRANLTGLSMAGADLTGADLSGADLTHADLSNAKLHNARLYRANLYNANLARVDLTHAVLSHAHLGYANLAYANLNMATLAYAVLTAADLTGADLTSADLTSTNLTEAKLIGATLPPGHNDLSGERPK